MNPFPVGGYLDLATGKAGPVVDGVCHLPVIADLVRSDESPAQSALLIAAVRLRGAPSQRQKAI